MPSVLTSSALPPTAYLPRIGVERTCYDAGMAREPVPGQQQDRGSADADRLDGERGVQSEVAGEAAEQLRGGDHEHAAEQQGGAVGAVAVTWRGGQGDREGEGIEVGDVEPRTGPPAWQP